MLWVRWESKGKTNIKDKAQVFIVSNRVDGGAKFY